MLYHKAGYVCLFVAFAFGSQAQQLHFSDNGAEQQSKTSFVDVYLGSQWSGIKKEDFIRSNFSPYIQVGVGKRLTPAFTLMLNYQGFYFNYIGDNSTHKYLYLGGDVLLNPIWLINKRMWPKVQIYLAGGIGYFYNYLQQKPAVCLDGALIGEYIINDNYSLKLKVGGIGGWKIYQHDKDVLPNVAVGISRRLY